MDANQQKIGKYDIVAPLGKGAMGVVYKAFDPMIKRFVALKTIHLGFTEPPDDDIAQRFHREAQAAGNLNHQNIVGIYEYGEDAGRAFIAMQYVEGQTLVDLLKGKHRFSLADIQLILSSVLAALDYSHRKGVIHRDVKPGNIMRDNTGTVKVMDFRIARIESSELTQTGTILGTPGYMSPEQLLGETVDLRSDLYSAGIVLYELLTGERAFTGSSFASVIYKVIHSDLAPPSHLKPTLPGNLDALVAKACAKKKDDRYQTAGEFTAALNHAFSAITDAPRVAEPSPVQPGPIRTDDPSAAVAAAKTGRKWFAAVAILAAAAGLALAAWFLLPVGREDKQTAAALPGTAFKDCDTCPVTCVSWNDANAYLRWLADRTGREYRLLSASEWEYAARAGTANIGTVAVAPTDACESANVADRSTLATYPGWEIFDCRDDFVHTAPVGSFQANAFGLHDMIGNVFEWVTDCWNDNYEKAPLDGAAWENGDCSRCVLRGGSWFTPPGYVRTAFRNRFDPDYRSSSFGFRVARLP